MTELQGGRAFFMGQLEMALEKEPEAEAA